MSAAAEAAAVVAVVAVVAAAEEAVDLTAHLGGIADRLTVNWHCRLIGLLKRQIAGKSRLVWVRGETHFRPVLIG